MSYRLKTYNSSNTTKKKPMNIREDYIKDMTLFRVKTEKIARLILGEEKDKCEAMWLLGCLHEICNQKLKELEIL